MRFRRDTMKKIKEMKSEANYSKENRAKEYLFNSNKKLEIVVPIITPPHIPSEAGPVDKKKASFYASDYMYLLETMFPESTRSTNLLLNRGNTTTDYTMENGTGPA